ncbi:MAG: phosphopantetheine-binding protein, partial [Sulfurovaceae bacterium]|nr:phosphopantetheine-binding protein [Sulfurovaceae bacterium]
QFEKNPEDISMDKTLLDDLGLDSLDIFDLICALEDEYGFHFERQMESSINTVGDVVAQIDIYLSQK